MDFQPQMNFTFPTGVPLPYFMAYPDYPCIRRPQAESENGKALQDFEYLRRTYPAAVGKMQRRVEEILDKMDYEGSMIYDEYPDYVSLQNLGDAVSRILRDENLATIKKAGQKENQQLQREATGELQTAEREDAFLQGLAQVLVCNEIYRRRRKRKQDTYGRIATGFNGKPE